MGGDHRGPRCTGKQKEGVGKVERWAALACHVSGPPEGCVVSSAQLWLGFVCEPASEKPDSGERRSHSPSCVGSQALTGKATWWFASDQRHESMLEDRAVREQVTGVVQNPKKGNDLRDHPA